MPRISTSESGGGRGGVLKWKISPEDAFNPKLDHIANNLSDSVYRRTDPLREKMVAYAKVNAAWMDRTTRARAGIFGGTTIGKTVINITLSHRPGLQNRGFPYPIALETDYGLRYAIIMPTLEKYAPYFMKNLDGLLDELAGG